MTPTHQRIGLTLDESVSAPQPDPYRRGAPNVIVMILDDLGFGQLGCYGSPLDTPNIDRLAAGGLRYTNFHTTAVCSPTRACVLTGRNHHRVGMGMLPDIPLPFPAYTGVIPPEAVTLPAILRDQGWATWCIGKWHLSPRDHRTPAGPFHTWPTGQGFDRYYGFLGGESSQWTPAMIRDQSYVGPPRTPDEGYHFTEDIADEAIDSIRSLRLHQPDRPFMMYWATGAPHSPHQVPSEWVEHHRGRFDAGWDELRDQILAGQQAAGIVPADVELSDRPDWVAAWDDLPDDEQHLYARLQEVFAGFLSHADAQIGRIVDELERLGELDNTLIVLLSDNGASGEGGPHGSVNHLAQLNNTFEDIDDLAAEIDQAGGHRGYNHYPWGWAFAGNTPLRRWKRYTYEGGVRDPLIVHWPAGIQDAGGVRHQYCHAIDVLPTIVDLLEVEVPDRLGGVEQMSIDGVSLRPTLDDADADEVRTTQYYECWGSRALYHEGWKVVTDHVNQLNPYERERMDGSADFRHDRWSLFHSAEDFVEAHDLAADRPDKLRELIDLWWAEAGRNGVLPLDDAVVHRFPHMHMPYSGMRSRYELQPGERVMDVAGPLLGGGFSAAARLARPLAEQVGTICEQGDWIAGWSWVLHGDSVTYHLEVPNRGPFQVHAPRTDGATVLGLTMALTDDDAMLITHLADGAVVSVQPLPVRPSGILDTNGAWLTAGHATPFPVSDSYQPPFALDGLDRLVIDARRPEPPRVDELIDELMRHQ
ncbi:MAG: arylsulfatase [Acidimicrobiia bacterium]|nr:arylsulfatase [Acidimicrobiia bacterium]